MPSRSVGLILLIASTLAVAQTPQSPQRFLGRRVTITKPKLIDDRYPEGPATICLDGPPQRQCYTSPEDFGANPTVMQVQIDKNTPALFFQVATGGVSGWRIHF